MLAASSFLLFPTQAVRSEDQPRPQMTTTLSTIDGQEGILWACSNHCTVRYIRTEDTCEDHEQQQSSHLCDSSGSPRARAFLTFHFRSGPDLAYSFPPEFPLGECRHCQELLAPKPEPFYSSTTDWAHF